MLDDLLGRTELKARIEDLEEEKRHLERQLEAEQERRAAAASDRQDAEERVNRLEDRIADLEGRLEREDAEGADVGFRHRSAVRGERCRAVLDRLDSFETDPEGILTAMVEEDVPGEFEAILGDRVALVSRAAPCLVVADDAGLLAVALDPPVTPEPFLEWGDTPAIERSWFLPEGSHAVALVRADLFALAEFDGEREVAFEGFESDVKSDHSKGGFSQGRFERVREGQIADHLDRCRAAVADRDVDPLYVVGDRRLIREFADRAAATAAVDATGSPRAAIDDAVHDFWTTRVSGL
jgi:peptide subunit release factor 1 (eRF1)